jgi:hypothetical protein
MPECVLVGDKSGQFLAQYLGMQAIEIRLDFSGIER